LQLLKNYPGTPDEFRNYQGILPEIEQSWSPFPLPDAVHGQSVLIRHMEDWLPELSTLWQVVDWIPSWLRSDMMLSISGPAGSVGPHSDQYDVFLVHLSGERIWYTAPPNPNQDFHDLPVQWIKDMNPTRRWHCPPGSILYIPPRWQHWGISSTAAQTLSLGFRAPALHELLEHLSGLPQADRVLPLDFLNKGSLPAEAAGPSLLEHTIRQLRDLSEDTQSQLMQSLILSRPVAKNQLEEMEELADGGYLYPAAAVTWLDSSSVLIIGSEVLCLPVCYHSHLKLLQEPCSIEFFLAKSVNGKLSQTHYQKRLKQLLEILVHCGLLYTSDVLVQEQWQLLCRDEVPLKT
jgi:hypothetical protein